MTVITFLGTIGEKDEEAARYRFTPDLAYRLLQEQPPQTHTFVNMLPLLITRFEKEKVVAIGTRRSVAIQKNLLARSYPNYDLHRVHFETLVDEQDYRSAFTHLGNIIDASDGEIVVDISHSFRHIPVLMIVEMLIENIKDPNRIQYILFAKEIEPRRLYEIVDLREYLTLANVSYALASFTKNYTVTVSTPTKDEIYQALLNELSRFSEHILANSLEALIIPTEKERSITEEVLSNIEKLRNHPSYHLLLHPIVRYLETIESHMNEILKQAKKPYDERYYYFAKLMYDKGYFLNAITLLNEAIAAYCIEGLRKKSGIKKAMNAFERAIEEGVDTKIYNRYELSNICKNIIKFGNRFKKSYPKHSTDTATALTLIETIKRYIDSHFRQTKTLRDLIYKSDTFRNNFAHANSADRLMEVRQKTRNLLISYEDICQIDDPLRRF